MIASIRAQAQVSPVDELMHEATDNKAGCHSQEAPATGTTLMWLGCLHPSSCSRLLAHACHHGHLLHLACSPAARYTWYMSCLTIFAGVNHLPQTWFDRQHTLEVVMKPRSHFSRSSRPIAGKLQTSCKAVKHSSDRQYCAVEAIPSYMGS